MVGGDDRGALPAPAGELTNRLIGRLQRCKWVLSDPATWRDLLWTLVNVPVSVVLGLLPAFLLVAVTWTLVADFGNLFFGWWPGTSAKLLGAGVLPEHAAALRHRGAAVAEGARPVASSLLAPTREEMAAQVGQLTESRSQAVDASAAELRRIERDLHDGAQARLVALGMNIGFAEQVLRDNPDLALSLLAEARASSGQALSELRALVRGIHPPVLAERGLDGAVRALALSLPLPVDLHIDLAGRASAPVESAALLRHRRGARQRGQAQRREPGLGPAGIRSRQADRDRRRQRRRRCRAGARWRAAAASSGGWPPSTA